MNIEDRHWLRVREFAGCYGISVKHTYELLSRGLVPGVKRAGFGWMINRRLFEKQLESSLEMKGMSQ